ncbi:MULTISPECIES: hypothetical protein [Sinorhizobium/Ensifer group]|jgi:hypothetical protein|uniref:hypothetical protein n=1 Tax=Sinorhizobium/Ensifer group TaxID=227292 RepID=UPI00071C6ED3|nr:MULTISPECIES: hypothetical protein [Sinorhizobium/Ensifer group]KSV78334.1 hypothetical protein N183_18655 [Sinorhizobium sp. Sb3]KSV94445.1 hypothetical protein N184_17715 [Sinorhizobium sp. GL28]MBD9507562.1 hypothetical protein [Ensifer sp. ENS10]MBV7519654.1 hypothetical protein [Ensifer sp. ENS12]
MFDWISILLHGILQVNFPRRTGAEMSCDTFERTERKPFLSIEPVIRLTAALFGGLVAPKPMLDVNALSDHMKRDMGFMDVHSPHSDDEEAMANARRLLSINELPRI